MVPYDADDKPVKIIMRYSIQFELWPVTHHRSTGPTRRGHYVLLGISKCWTVIVFPRYQIWWCQPQFAYGWF